MLAETKKKRSEEYRANKTTADNAFGSVATTAPTPSTKSRHI